MQNKEPSQLVKFARGFARKVGLRTARNFCGGHKNAHTYTAARDRLRKVESYPTMSKKDAKLTKSQLLSELASKTDLSKAKVSELFDALYDVLKSELRRTGELTILPGLIKVRKVHKKATKARKGRNPATGEEITIAAKPARQEIKLSKLKALKGLA